MQKILLPIVLGQQVTNFKPQNPIITPPFFIKKSRTPWKKKLITLIAYPFKHKALSTLFAVAALTTSYLYLSSSGQADLSVDQFVNHALHLLQQQKYADAYDVAADNLDTCRLLSLEQICHENNL